MIYLDNSATTKQYDEVSELIFNSSRDLFANPSSLHTLGFEASKEIKRARQQLEKALPAGRVIFTSGGTESDNMALVSAAHKQKRRGRHIITSRIEHPAVSETCKRLADDGFEIDYLPVDETGFVSPGTLKDALRDDTILVSVMAVNNEVGTIEAIDEICAVIKSYNRDNGSEILFHSDAVQAFGKLDLSGIKADMISASAHKFHGPKGAGLLYMKDSVKIPAFITGGGQEGGLRSSTENTQAILGMGLAAEMSTNHMENRIKFIGELNDYLKNGLMGEITDIRINGPEQLGYSLKDAGKRCPAVLNISFEGTRGEVLLHTLEQDGIYVSTGSACSSNHPGASPVLQAMKLKPKEIEGAIRFSFSEFNTIEEMDIVIDKTKAAVERFRKLGSYQ